MDQDVVDDPYPLAAVLRRECPVFREPHYNVVVVTRYDDLIDVARRPQDFSSILAAYGPSGADRGPVPAELCTIAQRAGGPDPAPKGRVAELLAEYQPDLQDQLQHVDPPLHTRHRRIVNRWFSPRAVAVAGRRHPCHRHTADRPLRRRWAGGDPRRPRRAASRDRHRRHHRHPRRAPVAVPGLEGGGLRQPRGRGVASDVAAVSAHPGGVPHLHRRPSRAARRRHGVRPGGRPDRRRRRPRRPDRARPAHAVPRRWPGDDGQGAHQRAAAAR